MGWMTASEGEAGTALIAKCGCNSAKLCWASGLDGYPQSVQFAPRRRVGGKPRKSELL